MDELHLKEETPVNNEEHRVLIEETDAGRYRREHPEDRGPKKPKREKKAMNKWVIVVAAVVLVALLAGLAVALVRHHKSEELATQTTSAVATTAPTEAGVDVEDALEHIATGEDALGGEMGVPESTEASSWRRTTASSESSSEDTTAETTRNWTTIRNPGEDISKAVDDFWEGVSKQVS